MSINSCLLVLYNRTQVKIQVYEYDKRNIAYRRKMTQTKINFYKNLSRFQNIKYSQTFNLYKYLIIITYVPHQIFYY